MCKLEDEGVGVGADPEIFAVDKDGIHRSLIGKLGGSKAVPLKTKHGWVQEDNVAGEFNTPPAYSEDEFVMNITNVLGDISELLIPLDLSIDISPIALFEETELQHELAKIAGCDPDFNGWDLIVNTPPNLSATRERSGAGHLHISWSKIEEDPFHCVNLSRVMDITAGAPSILMDDDTRRRELYGKASCHRPKFKSNGDAYNGIEYRTLSNFWLKSEKSIRWAYNTVRQAITRYEEFVDLINDGGITRDEIVSMINTSDKNRAEAFCHKHGIAIG